jgi:hypothetical protein
MQDLIRSRFLEKEICLTDNDMLNPSPQINWNIVESGVKQHQTNMLKPFFFIDFDSYFASLHKTRQLLDFIKEATEIDVIS